MSERGTAVGFSDTKEKEGVAPVGVGSREVVMTLEPKVTVVKPGAELADAPELTDAPLAEEAAGEAAEDAADETAAATA
jgi:hypothetical protein